MRQSSFDSRRSATMLLMIANVAAFLLGRLLSLSATFPPGDYLAQLDGSPERSRLAIAELISALAPPSARELLGNLRLWPQVRSPSSQRFLILILAAVSWVDFSTFAGSLTEVFLVRFGQIIRSSTVGTRRVGPRRSLRHFV
jgi:hypothetical protein